MKKWILNILFVFFAAVFLVSAFILGRYFLKSLSEKGNYDELSEMMHETTGESTPQLGDITVDYNPFVTVTDPTGAQIQIYAEFKRLYERNSDLVGWIQIPGTKIDYPVVQTPEDPEYYLKRNFDKESSSHGCIFAQGDSDVHKPSDNVTLYGHHMRDGSMFADLKRYKEKSFWESNKMITYNTLQHKGEYEIFAVFLTTASFGKGFRYNAFVDAANEAEFDDFVDKCKDLSLYDTGITPTYGDKLITLSTCDYSQTDGRLAVVARRIDD